MKTQMKTLVAVILGVPFIFIGVEHFLSPELFDVIVPAYLGFPRFWTLASGVVEVLLGIGIILPPWRRWAARFLAMFLVCVYLANLNMWLNDIPFNGMLLGQKAHVIRLMVQLVLISVVLWLAEWTGRTARKATETGHED